MTSLEDGNNQQRKQIGLLNQQLGEQTKLWEFDWYNYMHCRHYIELKHAYIHIPTYIFTLKFICVCIYTYGALMDYYILCMLTLIKNSLNRATIFPCHPT